jgi:sugar phosphate isomerase/epimerase
MQKIYPSLHMLEIFMPVVKNEEFFFHLIEQVQAIPFYKGIELGLFCDSGIRKKIHKLVERNSYQLTVWLSPSIAEHGFNLASFDPVIREKAVAYTKDCISMAAEMGVTHCGLPSGPYTGAESLEESKRVLFDSYVQLYEHTVQYNDVDLTLEPLDRYVHKKQILGPMTEVVAWFASLHKMCPKFFIHWDSAHEQLGNINLIESLELASSYIAQIHICNCINNPQHPCFGDWHMDVGRSPDFSTWGYLTPDVAADILKNLSAKDTIKGIKRTFCAVEVRSHMGDDMWEKEKLVRSFLQESFRRAKIDFDR